jgi:L,D-transpeptidase ErfK/SrfK
MIRAFSRFATRCCTTLGRGRRQWLAATTLLATTAASPTLAAEYPIGLDQQMVGEIRRYTVREGEVLADIARHFDVGYTALVLANPGVDPWLPGAGREVTIPALYILPDAPHQGVVINLAQWRLYYFPPGGGRVETFPLGLGVIGKKTPLGVTRVVSKEANPAWYPPPSIRAERPELPGVVPAGPDNPLGAYALHLGWTNYLIHGTNKPDGVGRNVSHGCIRLYPEDIEHVFNVVGIGTPVRSVDQSATAGWGADGLYVQVHPSKSQVEEVSIDRHPTPEAAQGVEAVVRNIAGRYTDTVDWGAVAQAARQRTGMPVRVAPRPPVDVASERLTDGLYYPPSLRRFP